MSLPEETRIALMKHKGSIHSAAKLFNTSRPAAREWVIRGRALRLFNTSDEEYARVAREKANKKEKKAALPASVPPKRNKIPQTKIRFHIAPGAYESRFTATDTLTGKSSREGTIAQAREWIIAEAEKEGIKKRDAMSATIQLGKGGWR